MLTELIRGLKSGVAVQEYLGPANSGSPARIWTWIASLVKAGVLPLDDRGMDMAPIAGPLPFRDGDWGSGPVVILAPVPSACRPGAPTVVIALPFVAAMIMIPPPPLVSSTSRINSDKLYFYALTFIRLSVINVRPVDGSIGIGLLQGSNKTATRNQAIESRNERRRK
jgi:hypothetical protein